MACMMGIFKVEDFARWKDAFDTEEGAAVRKAAGMKSYQMFHVENEPNSVVLLCEFDDLENARRLAQSDELRTAHQQAGATGKPDSYYLVEIEKRVV